MYDELLQALKRIKQKLKNTPDFKDLRFFKVVSYTAEEIEEYCSAGERNWVGQYSKGSVDSDEGITILVNIDAHEDSYDLEDTLAHELGHALWELLDEKSKELWLVAEKDHRHGAEESFADHLMYFLRQSPLPQKELFLEVTSLQD